MKTKKIGVFCALLTGIAFASSPVFATYDANLLGIPTDVLTYPDGTLLFRLSNQPTNVSGCNNTYFAVDKAADAEALKRMYARLLTAHALQESIFIGYDGTADCIQGYIHVWRIG